MKDERGAAAVEMALVFLVVAAIFALVAPLPVLLVQQNRLEEAAGRTIRWATSAPGGVRPRQADLPGEARSALRLAGGSDEAVANLTVPGGGAVLLDTTTTASRACPKGRARRIELRTTISLGAYGALLGVAGIGNPDRTLRASATSCEE